MPTIWLTGAEGIGKTFCGSRVAAELGLVFTRLDDLRPQVWAKLQDDGVRADTEFGRCDSYEDARTLALRSMGAYLKLYARLGPPMVAALQGMLPDRHKARILVECAPKYLAALPPSGLRIRGFVTHSRHVNNLRIKCELSTRDAALMAEFFQSVEAKALADYPVDAHVPLDDLAAKLGRFLT